MHFIVNKCEYNYCFLWFAVDLTLNYGKFGDVVYQLHRHPPASFYAGGCFGRFQQHYYGRAEFIW